MWLDGLAAADSSLCVRLSSPLSLLWCGRVPETHPTRCPRPSVVLQRALTAHPSVSPLTCQGLAQGAPRQWGAERGVWSVGRLPTQTSEAPADSTPPSLSSSSPRQVPPGSFLQVAPSFSLLGHQSLGTWWPFGVVCDSSTSFCLLFLGLALVGFPGSQSSNLLPPQSFTWPPS